MKIMRNGLNALRIVSILTRRNLVPNVYLDSTVLIALLYGQTLEPNRFEQCRRLRTAIQENLIDAVVSFYTLPELYDYVELHQPQPEVNAVFRLGLVELFSLPVRVAPFLDRAELNKLRQQFQITDPDDARHVAAALFKKCDAIITFDHDFQQVAGLIPAYTPAEFLATLPQKSNAE
jgi:predicted nucleic acid-binding protein